LRRQKGKRRSGGAAERLDEAEWKMYREAMLFVFIIPSVWLWLQAFLIAKKIVKQEEVLLWKERL